MELNNMILHRFPIFYRMQRLICILMVGVGFFLQASAQEARTLIKENLELAGGVNCLYDFDRKIATVDAPSGYAPFYIVHYGRHGSRWAIPENEYTYPLNCLKTAHQQKMLTPKGDSLYTQLIYICAQANGRNGQLTALGEDQHRKLAQRMYERYPQVFADSSRVICRSTVVPRCILSMAAFTEQLRAQNSSLKISRESDPYYLSDLNPAVPESKYQVSSDFRHFKKSKQWLSHYEAIGDSLLEPMKYFPQLFKGMYPQDKLSFMYDLYNITQNLRNTPLSVRVNNLFSPELLFRLWQYKNYYSYSIYANSVINKGMGKRAGYPLLAYLMRSVDMGIAQGQTGAQLNFGHDTAIMSLLAAMEVNRLDMQSADMNEICNHWQNFKITPMAANVAMILYRKAGSDDVLVRITLNEEDVTIPVKTDCYPFYHWKDVKAYYVPQLYLKEKS